MMGGNPNDDRFATSQSGIGMAGASAGAASKMGQAAKNKASQATGQGSVNVGNFSGPIAAAGVEDVQKAVFGRGYTDLARGLARALGQDPWSNRDNFENQQNQSQAFLNQVANTGRTNIVPGGFSTNGMNITQNAMAIGGKGAGSAAANAMMPLGLKGQTQQDLSARIMSNVSPYLSRAEALANASASNQLERALSGQPRWAQQVENTYRSQDAFDEAFAQRGNKYPVMNRDMTARNRGFTGTQTQEKPTYSDVPPNKTGNLNYQSPYSQELWVDSIDPKTGHFDAQKFLNPVTTPTLQLGQSRNLRNEGLPSRNIASELREQSRAGQADEMNIHQRNWAAEPQGKPDIPNAINAEVKRQMAQDAVKMRVQQQQKGGGFGDLDGRAPGVPQMLKEELAKLDNPEFARQQYQQWAKEREASIWESYDIPKNPPWGVPMNGDFDALGGRGPVDFNELGKVKPGGGANGSDHPLRQLLKQAEQGVNAQRGLDGRDQSSNQDVIAIPSEDPDGGRFGKEFGETLAGIARYADGRDTLVSPYDPYGSSGLYGDPGSSSLTSRGGFPKGVSIGATSGKFLRTLFDHYMGGLAPGNWDTTNVLETVRRWLGGQRANPEIDPRIEADLVKAGIEKANSAQKVNNFLGVGTRQKGRGVQYGSHPMYAFDNGTVYNDYGSKSTTSEGFLKAARWQQDTAGSGEGGPPLPATMPINSTAQANFMNALKAYERAMKGAGHNIGRKVALTDARGQIRGPGSEVKSAWRDHNGAIRGYIMERNDPLGD
jgi:hypothetical protein